MSGTGGRQLELGRSTPPPQACPLYGVWEITDHWTRFAIADLEPHLGRTGKSQCRDFGSPGGLEPVASPGTLILLAT